MTLFFKIQVRVATTIRSSIRSSAPSETSAFYSYFGFDPTVAPVPIWSLFDGPDMMAGLLHPFANSTLPPLTLPHENRRNSRKVSGVF
jgi:hypothetical protein